MPINFGSVFVLIDGRLNHIVTDAFNAKEVKMPIFVMKHYKCSILFRTYYGIKHTKNVPINVRCTLIGV